MMPARAGQGQRYTRTMIFMLPVFCMFMLVLAGCKKDDTKTEAADTPAASVFSSPAEVDPAQPASMPPSAQMKSLTVHTIPAESPVIPLPDMKPVTGMDLSVRISHMMKTTPGWTQNFSTFYKPVNDCLMQTDGGAAYAATMMPASSHTLAVHIVGLDGHWQECLITEAGGQALYFKPIEEQPENGPAFFPRDAGKPLPNDPQCLIMEPVVARPGGLIGWIAFRKNDCTINPAAP